MVCDELLPGRRTRNGNRVEIGRFQTLHDDGRRLIISWFERALGYRDCVPEESFEPFIFAWLAFNAWAACVTEADKDAEWKYSLMVCPEINRHFDDLRSDQEGALAGCVHEFAQQWPIFKAQELRRRRVHFQGTRHHVVEQYLDADICYFEPQCARRHRQAGAAIPEDWPHTLSALYRTRCNLFHGEKASFADSDQLIVWNAFRVLTTFLELSGYLGR